ncbi:MAG: flippase-like domain-containing protein [Deltaproteobacteria bacterium]|jgi:uncharacterized protein (TIRG00374 family)|nr:flippase-like domain-containing protein [Deltaproteobacteria bacterium]MBW2532143.1 flippase-like domain-containing protein [Deltaproteobacteria bacterium]
MAPEDPQPSRRRRLVLRLAVSLLIGVAIGWMLVRGGLPIVPPRSAFRWVEPEYVAAYCACLFGVHWFRAARWRHLLRPLGRVSLRSTVATAWIGFAAVLLLPLRTGEAVRPLLIARRSTVRGWEAAGTVGAERIIDGLALSGLFLAGLVATTPREPLPDHIGDLALPVRAVPQAAYTALGVFAAIFVVMLVFYRQRQLARKTIRATFGLLSPRLAERIATVVGRVADGLGFLPSARRLMPFLLETACYWILNAGGLWVLALGCGLPTIGLGEACVIMGCIGIGILTPAAPGYFGTFQLSIYVALAMFVLPGQVTEAGSAYAFVVYVCQVGQHVLLALAGAAMDHRGTDELVPAEPDGRRGDGAL